MHPSFAQRSVLAIVCTVILTGTADAQWIPRVILEHDSKIDWHFAASHAEQWVSPVHMRNDTLDGKPYCEIDVPRRYDAKKPTPVLLYLSPSPEPQAFRSWKRILQRKRMIYVAPHHVGNNVAPENRIERAILALDHVRTKYNVDPDQTYVVGFSGGARIANYLAYSYPEYFGGMILIGSGGRLPSEDWLIDRIEARLSVALITGTQDGFQPEVEHSTYKTLNETGVRTRLWLPRTGHKLPAPRIMDEAIQWLDEGLDDRRALAAEYPATRLADSPTLQQCAQRFLDEATQRIAQQEQKCHGILMLEGIANRWPETNAGTVAKALFAEYDQGNDQAWKNERHRILVHRLVARAKGSEAFATAKRLHQFETQRPNMIREAIGTWQAVRSLAIEGDVREMAAARLEILEASMQRIPGVPN